MKFILKIGRVLLGVIAGYAVIVIGTILTFEVLLGGIGYYKSSSLVLGIASVGAFVVGFLGGCVAALIGGRSYLLSAAGVLLPLVLDTTYVINSGISKDPLWYDLIGAGTLMFATLVGGYFLTTRTSKEVVVTV
jgi:hypothetical protein